MMARVNVNNSETSGIKRHFENAVFGTGAAVSAAPAANDDACERVSGAEEKEPKPVLLRERDVWSADEKCSSLNETATGMVMKPFRSRRRTGAGRAKATATGWSG